MILVDTIYNEKVQYVSYDPKYIWKDIGGAPVFILTHRKRDIIIEMRSRNGYHKMWYHRRYLKGVTDLMDF